MSRTAPLLLLIPLLLAGCLSEAVQGTHLPPKAEYLLADRFPDLTITVRHVAGWEPSQLALDGVRSEVLRLTGRTRLHMAPSQAVSASAGPDGLWSDKELGALFGRVPADPTTIVLLFVDGGQEDNDDSSVRWGVAIGAYAVVFVDEFDEQGLLTVSGRGLIPRFNRAEIERAVAVHEVGHVLGLVANGVPRSHGPGSDDECRCHSGDPDSVMYKEADSDHNPAFLAGVESAEVSYRFTDDDIADVRAFQLQYGFMPGL